MNRHFARRVLTAVMAAILVVTMGAAALTLAADHEHVFVDGICTECGKYEAPFITRIPLKEKYTKAIEETGTLETIDYMTPLYGIDESQEMEKHLQVYLPYGYDESQQYNVMYIMHGGGESEYYWLNDTPVYEGTKAMGKTTKGMIDNMVKDGKMEPTIFVAPTSLAPKGLEEGEGEGESRGAGYDFGKEFREVIVPLVEAKYSTYCAGDVSEENLIATRDHRGFGGFSMGSACTINQIMMKNLDIVSWFGAWSGGGAPIEEFKAAIDSFGPDMNINYMYNGNGTSDFALEGHQELYNGILEQMGDKFQDGKNLCWICFKGGSHAYNCWIVDLYNCMLVFFK